MEIVNSIKVKILEAIKQYETIIIHRHIRPDGDCIGAQVGFKRLITENFPEKNVYMVGEEDEKLQVLGRMDDIEDDVYEHALVIVLDTAEHQRISDQRYRLGEKIINIDHHPRVESIGDLEWIDSSYTSVCEMIIDFFDSFPELQLSPEGRQALFYGIVTDTNRFLNPAVTKDTFRRLGILLNESVDLTWVYQKIYQESIDNFRLRGYVMNHLVTPGNGLGYFIVDHHMTSKYNLTGQSTSSLANTIRYVDGVLIWFIGIEDPQTRKVRISLRSDRYSINQIAEQFGGGGHPYASGMVLSDVGMVPMLVNAISDYLKEIQKRED